MTLFHAYDIRGVYPDQMNEEITYQIGLRIPLLLNTSEVMIARDARSSSPSLRNSLVKGLLDAGAHVTDIGVVSTPHAYFAQRHLQKDALVIITASHNPAEYNGIKLMGKNGQAIGFDEGLGVLQEMLGQSMGSSPKKGTLIATSVQEAYISFMTEHHSFPFRLVIDQSDAPAQAETECLRRIATVISVLNAAPSSTPSHSANPLDSHSQQAVKILVREHKADFGVVFDGDADRVVFIDELARVVPPDIVTGILAQTYDAGTVVYEVRTSRSVEEKIRELGLVPLLSKAGRTNMMRTMAETGAVLAGEKSGHYFFSECYAKECVGIAVRKVMEVMHSTGKPLSVLSEEMSLRYSSLPETNFEVSDVKEVFGRITSKYTGQTISTLDGITITFDDGSWFNLRESNTQSSLVRLNMESPSAEGLKELFRAVSELIR